MSSSDPQHVVDALERAADAFEHVGHGRPQFEADIDPDEDWKTQLTKACRLREVAGVLQAEDGYYPRSDDQRRIYPRRATGP